MRRIAALALTFAAAASASAQAPTGRFVVGDQVFGTLHQAVNAIGDGEGTIHIPPGTYRDCAVQEKGRIAFVADKPGSVIFTRVTCEDKAALVLRGRGARVEGIVFTHLEVGDGNGAGIRLEHGNLSVVQSMFLDSQCGILTAEDPSATVSIDHSTFAGLGKDPTGNGAHAVYVGGYGAAKVTASRFERGRGGHYLKVRAPRVEIVGNSFDDTQGHTTNYMIDLSNGARGRIADNAFVMGRDKDNHSTMITVAPEGARNDSTGLVIEGNRASLAPGVDYKPVFVGNWSGEQLVIRGNALGAGITTTARRW